MPRAMSLLPRPIRSKLARRRLAAARLVACDLDGTLLNGDGMIGVRTARLIGEIIALGVEFVFITARHHSAASPFSDELHLDETIISLDGAMTSRPHRGEPESTIAMPTPPALEVAAAALAAPDVDAALVLADRLVVTDADMLVPRRHIHWNIDRTPIDAASLESAVGRSAVLELLASGSFLGVNRLHARVAANPAGLRIHLYGSESHPDLWYIEVRNENACKLRALEAYVRRRGIGMREVVAIGDARNDLEFCEKSGYTVAVKNAVAPLKRMADFVTARDCTDEGIDEFLEHFLEARRAGVTN